MTEAALSAVKRPAMSPALIWALVRIPLVLAVLYALYNLTPPPRAPP